MPGDCHLESDSHLDMISPVPAWQWEMPFRYQSCLVDSTVQ
jgi:hypothetical protein